MSTTIRYEDLNFKIPLESPCYKENSDFVLQQINAILQSSKVIGKNKVVLSTSLKVGLPLKDINKIAGPIVEAWALETFSDIVNNPNNAFNLINVKAQNRLDMADIILEFRKSDFNVSGKVDVKASSEDIKNSGKGPNITSFSRIRTAYVNDPDYMFIILAIKHKIYVERCKQTDRTDCIIELSDFNTYDLKYISDADLYYNPALGSGQIQVKDIHNIRYQNRTTWQMCQLLDSMYLNSSRRTINDFYKEACDHRWINQ